MLNELIKKVLICLLIVCFTVIPVFSCSAATRDNSSVSNSKTEQSKTESDISKDEALSKLSSALEESDNVSKEDSSSKNDVSSEVNSSSSESSSSVAPVTSDNSSSGVTESSSSSATESTSSSIDTSSSEENSSQDSSSSSKEEESPVYTTSIRNCVNVLEYGVEPNLWGVDQYDKFKEAIDTGKSIYVPAGYYYVSKSLKLRNQNLYGDGMYQTFIISIADNDYAPVLSLGRTSSVEDLFIGFDNKLITGDEGWIQRIGIITGDDYDGGSWCLQRGSQINRVGIGDVGTGICSCDLNNREGYTSFSVSYTNLEIRDFSYRGIDFTAKTRTGNVFSNIYMNSKYEVDSLFNMEGEESETSITQLNLEHTKVKRAAISLEGCRALAISTLHIEGIPLSQEGAAYVFLENTAGTIEALSVYYTAIDANNCSLIRIGDGLYDIHEDWQQTPPSVMSKIRIGTLHVKGLHNPNTGIHGNDRTTIGLNDVVGFNFIKRASGAQGDYKVIIYNYVYYTFQSDLAKYTAFATSGNVNVVFPEC